MRARHRCRLRAGRSTRPCRPGTGWPPHTCSASPTTRWSTRSAWGSGSPTPLRSRRTWRWPTSASTCSDRPGASMPTSASSTGPFRSEDDFAMLRDEREWRNVHLVEQERQDFGFEMARLLWFSAYQVQLYGLVAAGSSDETFRAVAREGGQGGPLPPRPRAPMGGAARRRHRGVASPDAGGARARLPLRGRAVRRRPASAWPRPTPVLGLRPSALREASTAPSGASSSEATLELPETPRWRSRGGRQGVHSAPMGYLLAEMQHVARSHPGATW